MVARLSHGGNTAQSAATDSEISVKSFSIQGFVFFSCKSRSWNEVILILPTTLITEQLVWTKRISFRDPAVTSLNNFSRISLTLNHNPRQPSRQLLRGLWPEPSVRPYGKNLREREMKAWLGGEGRTWIYCREYIMLTEPHGSTAFSMGYLLETTRPNVFAGQYQAVRLGSLTDSLSQALRPTENPQQRVTHLRLLWPHPEFT